jgi:hypothetical protein
MAIAGSATQVSGMQAGVSSEMSVLAAGGLALALGSVGVVATSALYAISPSAVALPAQPFDLSLALSGAIAGARTMYAAGTIGIFADVVMACGALLVAAELARRGRGVAALGWTLMAMSIIIFVFVDVIVAHLLGPLAAMKDGASAFAGFKRLFDALFLLGTAAFGAGAILALASELRASAPLVSRALALAGALIGTAAVLAATACFCGLPLEQGVGISVGLGAALFAVIGVTIARSA